MNIRAMVAEFLGAFALCFIGIGAIAATRGEELIVIALAHGLAIGLSIVALGAISGGHFNPAVTFAMLITGRITPLGAVGYWIAQLLGALAGAFFIGAIYQGTAVVSGTPVPGSGHTAVQALMMEIFLTFFLVSVIFGAAVKNNYSFAGIAIGLTITMDILAGGAISGAAMNPARAFGPALIGGEWNAHWVYWAGPLVGAGLAALVYDFVYGEKQNQ